MANLHPVPKVPVPCVSVISIGGEWEPPWKLDAAALGSQVRYARVADDDGIWWHGTRGGWVDAAVPAAERKRSIKPPPPPMHMHAPWRTTSWPTKH